MTSSFSAFLPRPSAFNPLEHRRNFGVSRFCEICRQQHGSCVSGPWLRTEIRQIVGDTSKIKIYQKTKHKPEVPNNKSQSLSPNPQFSKHRRTTVIFIITLTVTITATTTTTTTTTVSIIFIPQHRLRSDLLAKSAFFMPN